jgi:hypothetical protein
VQLPSIEVHAIWHILARYIEGRFGIKDRWEGGK